MKNMLYLCGLQNIIVFPPGFYTVKAEYILCLLRKQIAQESLENTILSRQPRKEIFTAQTAYYGGPKEGLFRKPQKKACAIKKEQPLPGLAVLPVSCTKIRGPDSEKA